MRIKTTLTGCLLATLLLQAPSVWGQQVDDATRGTARQIGYAGVDAYQKGDYATAVAKLSKAYDVLRAPSLGLWLARSLQKQGKWVEAAERYLEVTRLEIQGGEVDVQKQAQADARREREQLLPQIPNLLIKISDAPESEVTVTLDGASVPRALLGEGRPVNPGTHVIEGRRGSQRVSASVNVAPGETKEQVLAFNAPNSSTTSPVATSAATTSEPGRDLGSSTGSSGTTESHSGRRTMAWVALGAGGVGLAVGGVTGVLAMSKRSDLGCKNDVCPATERSAVDSYNSLRTVSTVGFIAGVVFAGTGTVLLLTTPKAETTASATPYVGLGSAGIRGRF